MYSVSFRCVSSNLLAIVVYANVDDSFYLYQERFGNFKNALDLVEKREAKVRIGLSWFTDGFLDLQVECLQGFADVVEN